MARPRGAARRSASAILSMPELAEKRAVTGTSCLKCNAFLTLAASALGTNLPSRTTPLAWAARCVVCLPNAELSASSCRARWILDLEPCSAAPVLIRHVPALRHDAFEAELAGVLEHGGAVRRFDVLDDLDAIMRAAQELGQHPLP